jgi:hypothetical protein
MEYLHKSGPEIDLKDLWGRAVSDLQSRIMSNSAAGIWLPNLEPVELAEDTRRRTHTKRGTSIPR